jgi:glycosyltransferase involved in cell wall biosynthesis
MRVSIVTGGDHQREYGGGQVYVRNLVEALGEAGHEVNVAGDLSDIGMQTADVVHAHGRKAAAARTAAEAGVPCVVTFHHGGLVCPQGSLLDWNDRVCHRPMEMGVCTTCCLRGRWWGNVPPTVGRFLRRLPNIPFITPAMTTPLAVGETQEEFAALVRDVTMFVAPSAAAREALLRNGVRSDRVVLVPHGIKPFTPSPLPAAPPLRFAYVGRIGREKGLHVLVEAIRTVRGDFELHVLGQAHSKWNRRYLRTIGHPPRIFLHGHLAGDALAKAWARCHVTVMPTICMEAFGLVVAESFSLGRPVIVTECGGPAEQVRNGVDGLVVPANDASSLAAAMQRFVDNPQLAAGMAAHLPRTRTMPEHVRDVLAVYSMSL